MNRYYEFFCNMTDEEWERFAVEVLRYAGFQIETMPAYGTDGGQDFIVSYKEIKYIVSCKHYIRSGKHVGTDDELNITDRLMQFNVKGVIGFYSTNITTGLQNRLEEIYKNGNYLYHIYGPTEIINIMQYMDTITLQTYGLYPHMYYMNVTPDEYKPLKCMVCGKDCLTDRNIPRSLIGLAGCRDNKYDYVYGCKTCLLNVDFLYNAHLEMEQALHLKWLQGWENLVDDWIKYEGIELSKKFYKHRCKFLNRVRQRQLPQTDGTWYGINI